MYPLFFPPQVAPTHPAPECFRTPVDYDATCARYGRDVFRRPLGPCAYCGQRGGCNCTEVPPDPEDIEVIAFQIQLYELGLDAEWIRRQVAFRGMESRERLRYEFDGTEKFFTDGVPSSRVLPTGPAPPKALPGPAPRSPPVSPPQQYASPQRAPMVRRESKLRYMETAEAEETGTVRRMGDGREEALAAMLGRVQLGDKKEEVQTRRTGRRRRGRNRGGYA